VQSCGAPVNVARATCAEHVMLSLQTKKVHHVIEMIAFKYSATTLERFIMSLR
jgi:hypothetical protein